MEHPTLKHTPRIIDGQFEIKSRLGEGMTGVVYEVVRGDERWALKVLKLKAHLFKRSHQFIDAFKFEFSLLKDIVHRHVVRIGDFGWDSTLDQLYFTEELVEGARLDEYLANRSPEAAEGLFVQCLEALDAIHQSHVLHGDLKPSNIFVVGGARKPEIKILDLGMAHPQFRENGGTPAYFSPEKILKDFIDERSDLYSLAVTFYECLTGINPFKRNTIKETLKAQTAIVPPQPGSLNPQIPPYLNRILFRLLAKNPRERFRNTREVLSEVTFERERHEHEETKSPVATEKWIGRDAARSEIRTWVEGLKAFSVLAVSAEPGLGKTRLLQEVKYELELSEKTVRVLGHPASAGAEKNVFYLYDMDQWDEGGFSSLIKKIRKMASGLLLGVRSENLRSVEALLSKLRAPLTVVGLNPFKVEDINRFVSISTKISDPPQELIHGLFQETKGHPGYTVRLLQALCRENKLMNARGEWNLSLFREGVFDLNALRDTRTFLDDALRQTGPEQPRERARLLIQKAEEKLRAKSLDGLDEIFDETRKLIGTLPLGEERLRLKIGFLEKKAWYYIQGERLDEARIEVKNAQSLLEEVHETEKTLMLRLINFDAYILSQQGQVDRAIEQFSETRQKWKEELTLDEKVGVLNNDLGICLMKKGECNRALEVLSEDLHFFETHLKNSYHRNRCHYNLGTCYLESRNFKKAVNHYSHTCEGARKDRQWYLLLRAYNGLGNTFNLQKDPRDSLQYYQRALDLALYLNDDIAASIVAQNMGVIESDNKNFIGAEENLNLSLKLIKRVAGETPQILQIRARALLEMGEIHRLQGKFRKAREWAQAALQIVHENPPLKSFAYWVYLSLAETALDSGESSEFADLYPMLAHHAQTDEDKKRIEALRKRSSVDPTHLADTLPLSPAAKMLNEQTADNPGPWGSSSYISSHGSHDAPS